MKTNTPTQTIFCGAHRNLPDNSTRRLEGGLRLQGDFKESDQDQPLVTIVTVVYNNPITLERCIQSVTSQTYQNIEYIIIDGGSDKPTTDIIQQYAAHIDYFVSEPDNGIYSAMNKGISVAQGDYICLLNSDDFYGKTFVARSIELALLKNSNITYSNYYLGNLELFAEPITDGVLLGHLNICHNTFLVSKECYNRVGPYNEQYQIISDAAWIRKAFNMGESFHHLDHTLFTLTEGGMSSGSTEKQRRLFINEVIQSYIIQFPFLSNDDAEDLYLFRFNNARLKKLLLIANKYTDKIKFKSALSAYVEYCFKSRNNFKLSHTESDKLFLTYIEACNLLDIDKKSIRINTTHGCFSNFLENISITIQRKKPEPSKTILHFVSVFSAPSESFIYDLLCRLQTETEMDNFILYEHKLLDKERPFTNGIYVPWNDFRPEIRDQIYLYIFKKIAPNVVLAHFALNEWKLYKRLEPLGIRIPTISMTHGIDVFMLGSDIEYKNYIIENFCQRDNTKFTTVSDYLQRELISKGVPNQNISRIYNTANSRFFEYRKTENFFDFKRELKILSIGRFIDLKGHTDLLHGFRWFLDHSYKNASLTLVYGNNTDNLPEIKSLIKKLKLSNHVHLTSFINFDEDKDYYTRFDIYAQSSKYSVDGLNRSETFGVACLEAILSGLPVVVTKAGGLPEVIGNQGTFSRIVPHSSGISIGQALKWFCDNPTAFSNNIEYAKQRLDIFSPQKQMNAICKEIEMVSQAHPKAIIFSTSTVQGAGYAAFRLFKGLRDLTLIDPTLYTTVSNHESEQGINVVSHPSGNNNGWSTTQDPNNSKPGLTIFTMDHQSIDNQKLWEWVKDYDVINIHWSARFLSVENIAFLSRIGKPLIMTIRDMQPITGGCHVFHGCSAWMESCTNCPQLFDNYNDYPSKILQAKQNTYNYSNITLVALSHHTKNILTRAPYFKNCRIEVIPNSIETDVFFPTDRLDARKKLGLPLDRKIIGYIPSFSSEVKGYKEVVAAFSKLAMLDLEINPMIMLVGNKTPADEAICLDKISLGYISDNQKLSLAYSAADVIIVPSLEETFSNTTAEAISCGTPVIGFKTGAIPDLAKDGISGYSYEIGDVDGLVEGLVNILSNAETRSQCRSIALKHLKFNLQSERYERLILELLNSRKFSYTMPADITSYIRSANSDQLLSCKHALERPHSSIRNLKQFVMNKLDRTPKLYRIARRIYRYFKKM